MKNPLLQKLAPIRIFHNLHNLLYLPSFSILRFLQSHGLCNRSEIVIFGPSILHKTWGRTTKAPQNVLIFARTHLLLSLSLAYRSGDNDTSYPNN